MFICVHLFAEDGDESADHARAAAALDTAASPKPRPLKKPVAARKAAPREARSSSASEAGEASGSDAEPRGSGAVGSTGRGQARGGGAAAVPSDPLEAWFSLHYSLLKSSGLMGGGLSPASAESGRPWANGSAKRRRGAPAPPQRKGRGAGAGRGREQRRQAEQQQQAHSSQVRCSAWEQG